MNVMKCDICGKFINKVVDCGIYYGNSNDIDPPDETWFCEKCAKREMTFAVSNPSGVIIGCWWIKPQFVSVAKSILRHKRKIAS